MKVFELLPRPLGNIFRKLTHFTCNSPPNLKQIPFLPARSHHFPLHTKAENVIEWANLQFESGFMRAAQAGRAVKRGAQRL